MTKVAAGSLRLLIAVGLVGIPAAIPAPVFAAAVVPPLTAPPLGERWFSITMNDEKTGFGYTRTSLHPKGYEIAAEGSVKMQVLGFSREAASRENYVVNRDLSLRSFVVEQIIDGSAMKLTGEVTPKGVSVVVESKGSRKERLIKSKGVVYPPAVLNVFPLIQGVAVGRSYRLRMLDVEAVKIKEVRIKALGVETLPDGVKAIHLRNDLYSVVDNDVWVDLAGNTLRESVRDGMIETRAEQEQAAGKFLVEAAVAKKDLILDFSRVTVSEPIEKLRDLSFLKVEIAGFPDNVPLVEGAGQHASRLGGGRVELALSRESLVAAPAPASEKEQAYLAPSDWILADHPRIVSVKDDILKGEKHFLKIIEALNAWVATNIREALTDSHSPIETLNSRVGNCQSHARLYVSLARAAGVPSKFVSGLVYVPDKGFLYHSWAESYAGGWIAVDPTFNELPANATHIKLVEGESPQNMLPIIGLIGKIRIKVIEKRHAGVAPGK